MVRKGVPEEEAKERVNRANKAFPNALVLNYDNLINNLKLPDENDRHFSRGNKDECEYNCHE